MELKIMAIMAKFFLKYGHNMATCSVNLDPIDSFYCIFMWQFLQKFQIWKKIYKLHFWKNFKQKNGLFIAFLGHYIFENFNKVFF